MVYLLESRVWELRNIEKKFFYLFLYSFDLRLASSGRTVVHLLLQILIYTKLVNQI